MPKNTCKKNQHLFRRRRRRGGGNIVEGGRDEGRASGEQNQPRYLRLFAHHMIAALGAEIACAPETGSGRVFLTSDRIGIDPRVKNNKRNLKKTLFDQARPTPHSAQRRRCIFSTRINALLTLGLTITNTTLFNCFNQPFPR